MGKCECVVIGNIDYNVSARLIASDSISQKCCRRQYVPYKDKLLFYNELFTTLKYGEEKGEEEFNLNEMPSLNAILLANYISENGVSVEYINYFNKEKQYLKEIMKNNPKAIVLSIGNITNAFPLLRVVSQIRNMNSQAKIIVNGLYIYNKWKTDTYSQFVTMTELVKADYYVVDIACEKEMLDLVKRIIVNDVPEEKYLISNSDEKSRDLEDDIDLKEWKYIRGEFIKDIMYLKTSKGCPASCSFCNFPIKNSNYKLEELELLENQLRQYEKHGVKYVLFADDTINLPVHRYKAMLRMMIKNHFSFEWFAYCRLKELDEEAIQLMKQANCAGVFIGIESANDNMLKHMNKVATVADFKDKLALLDKYDIMSFAFFLVGFPGETKETVQETIDFINNNKITFFTANLWYADISTPIYKEADRYGLKGKDFEWEHQTMTSEMASQYTDMMLLDVTQSIWVPNENFGFQAIPYLLSKNYSIDEIKALLISTAQLVKNNINNNHSRDEDIFGQLSQVLNPKGLI